MDEERQLPQAPAHQLSNFDRLASHLSADGLATALLKAWRDQSGQPAQNRLRGAVRDFHVRPTSENDHGAP